MRHQQCDQGPAGPPRAPSSLASELISLILLLTTPNLTFPSPPSSQNDHQKSPSCMFLFYLKSSWNLSVLLEIKSKLITLTYKALQNSPLPIFLTGRSIICFSHFATLQ